ncbi:SLBB domain-containing protein [Porticoccaceae bacterium]|nr:SLBB domain-containing protein [Porticoccaceae bacterium]
MGKKVSTGRWSKAVIISDLISLPGNFRGYVRPLLKGLPLILTLLSIGAAAQTVSPQMLQQFKSMPRAQQEALAKQYGLDLDQVLGGSKTSSAAISTPGQPLEQVELDRSDAEARELYELFRERYTEFEKTLRKKDASTKRYGRDLFDKEVSTFAPTDDASVPGDYRMGVGDNLVVELFGTENSEYDLQVTRDGEINVPKLAPIAIAGLTYEDALDLIKSRVAEQLLGAQATVSMGRLRAINIFMAGEVAVPGAYSVSALTTVTQALFQAGGISDIGSLRNIQVKRNGTTVLAFDIYQLLLNGDASDDLRLQSGDVVFVPPYDGLVTVEGAVKRPMLYEILGGESVADAIAMAGGLNSDAYDSAIAVVSKAVGKSLPGAKNIDLNDPSDASVQLRNGDQVRVPESTDNLQNAITLEGAVVRPGVYGWVPGQRVTDVITSIASDLKPYADLGYTLIVRQKNEQLDIEVLPVDLLSAFNDPDSDANVLTAPRDKIVVFGLTSVTDISSLDTDTDTDTETDADIDFDTDVDFDSATDTFTLTGSDAAAEAEAEVNVDDEITSVQRLALLEPIIEKLKSQARSGEPVQIVSISGAVKAPGDYPLGSQDTIANLVSAAGGLKDSVYLNSAELRSLYLDQNGRMSSRYRDLNLTSEIASPSLVLQSRDHLFVRELPEWNPTSSITLEGEIRFPGEYRIGKLETLSDVINRAGGLTQPAFQDGAVFTRKSISELEARRSQQFAQSIIRDFASSQLTKEDNAISIDEVQAIAEILQSYEGAGRLLVDIEAAMSGDALSDFTLEDGDVLMIPTQVSTVTVVGEVRRPGTHTLQPGMDLNDYLGLSAGMTARADEKELYVVKANGSVFRPTKSLFRFAGRNDALSAGDTIVVPVDAGYTDNLTLWREVTQVIFNTTAGLASVVAATK